MACDRCSALMASASACALTLASWASREATLASSDPGATAAAMTCVCVGALSLLACRSLCLAHPIPTRWN